MFRVILAMLLFSVGVFGFDEFQPIDAKSFGLAFSSYRPVKSSSGWDPLDVKGKVGLGAGIDFEMSMPYIYYQDSSGLGATNLALKKSIPWIKNVSALLAFDLPVGSKKMIGTNPAAGVTLAAVYLFEHNLLSTTGWVAYETESNAWWQSGAAEIYVDPSYAFTERFGAYLALDILQPTQDSPIFGVWPGIYANITSNLSISADVDMNFVLHGAPTVGITTALMYSL